MWCITTSGFVSLVEHDQDPTLIRARARRCEHLQDTFDLADADIIDLGPDCPDYRFHANIPRLNVAQKLYDAVMDLSYRGHVKESVAGADDEMYRAMLSCWTALHRLQTPVEPDGDWWTPGSTAAYGQFLLGGDVGGDDIASHTSRIADAMLDTDVRPTLTVDVWDSGAIADAALGTADFCLICGHDLNTGDPYVELPEDTEFGEPPGPAHLECAEDEGWKIGDES